MSFLETKATTPSDLLALSTGIDSKLALKLATPSALPSESSVLTIGPSGSTTASSVSATELGLLNGKTSLSSFTEDVTTTGKLVINAAGANQACLSIGGGATSTANPVAIKTDASEWLKGETDNQFATIQQLNTSGCRSRTVLHSTTDEHPNVSFDCNSANASGQPRVANSFYRFRFNYSGRFEIWPSTTGVKAHAYGTLSDSRLKWNDEPIVDGLGIVKFLRPLVYDKCADITDQQPEDTTVESGYIAQEVAAILPHVAGPGQTTGDPWSIRYSAMLPYHTRAIQELSETIDRLETRVSELENNVPHKKR